MCESNKHLPEPYARQDIPLATITKLEGYSSINDLDSNTIAGPMI
jgi:hypothetical protein